MRIYRIERKRLALVSDWLAHFQNPLKPSRGGLQMPPTKQPIGIKAMPPKRESPDVPQFFRLNVEVGDLDAATSFYTKLLGIQGRKQAGHRCYFDCGPVTLQVLDVSSKASRTQRQSLCTLRSTIWKPHLTAQRSWPVCLERKFMMCLEEAYSCARGASDRSMPKTHGEIPFVSLKREPFTRGNVQHPRCYLPSPIRHFRGASK